MYYCILFCLTLCSIFSMDGDRAPLREMVELKEKHGAWLMVDGAHATGLFGERRSGLIEQLGLSGRVEIQMGTLGKAIGAAGGFICGSRTLIDFLVNSARSFIFSTAPVPASAGAARAGVELIRGEEGSRRCKIVWEHAERLSPGTASPIIPLIIGDERAALAAADRLREQGFLIPAIRFPTVARGKARLRITVTADHTSEDIVLLKEALAGPPDLNSQLSTFNS
jgi:7-keto-8-aminopelargonate synthetase-like enzyme